MRVLFGYIDGKSQEFVLAERAVLGTFHKACFTRAVVTPQVVLATIHAEAEDRRERDAKAAEKAKPKETKRSPKASPTRTKERSRAKSRPTRP